MLVEAGDVEGMMAVAVQHYSRLLAVFLILVAKTTILSELLLGEVIGALPVCCEVALVCCCSAHVV